LGKLFSNHPPRHYRLHFHEQAITPTRKDYRSAILEISNNVPSAFLRCYPKNALSSRGAALDSCYLGEFGFDRPRRGFRHNDPGPGNLSP